MVVVLTTDTFVNVALAIGVLGKVTFAFDKSKVPVTVVEPVSNVFKEDRVFANIVEMFASKEFRFVIVVLPDKVVVPRIVVVPFIKFWLLVFPK